MSRAVYLVITDFSQQWLVKQVPLPLVEKAEPCMLLTVSVYGREGKGTGGEDTAIYPNYLFVLSIQLRLN